VQQVVGPALDDRVGAELLGELERRLGVARIAGPQQRHPAVVLDDRVLGILEPELLDRVDAPVGPVAEGLLDREPGAAGQAGRDGRLAREGLGLDGIGAGVEREPDDDAHRRNGGDCDVQVDTGTGRH
jgi:hypothetical protein